MPVGGLLVAGPAEQDVIDTVRSIVLELAPIKNVQGGRELNLASDLGYHSLALLEVIVALEDELGVPVTDDGSAMFITTLGDVEDYVTMLLAGDRRE
jgi:acyl carrier protein